MKSGANSSISNLARKNNYISKSLKYIKNTVIAEYDMKSAGLNILTELGYFTLEQKERMMQIPKYERNVIIGKMLRKDKQMVTDLEDGFTDARYTFLEDNGIDPTNVLSIKRDAIFLIGRHIVSNDISEHVKIRQDNTYTTYINIMNREHYYNIDLDIFHVKGYSKESIEVLDNHLFKFLRSILKYDVMKNKDDIYLEIVQFKDDLLSHNLAKEYYYDPIFNGYVINSDQNNYILSDIEDTDIEILSHNNILTFVNELTSYVL